jgi:hypothetical protein
MRSTIIALILVSAAFAETLHVTTVRERGPNDPPAVTRAFKTYVVEGTVGAVRYTMQQTYSWGSQRLEVGKDYEILKAKPQSLEVRVTDKKGRADNELLFITGTEDK